MISLLAFAFAEEPVEFQLRGLPGERVESRRPRVDAPSDALSSPPTSLWSVRLPGPPLNSASHTERGRPVVVGDRVLVGSAAGKGVYAHDRRDGAVVAHFESPGSVQAEPLVVEDRVFFADTAGTTSCYNLDGTLLWRHTGGAPILTRPTLSGNRLFLTTVDDLALALNARTGEQIWRYKAKRDLTRVAELALYAAPAAEVVGDEVVFGFSSGEVIALDAAGGEIKWQVAVGEGRYPDIVAKPVSDGNDLFVSGYFKPLVAIDKKAHAVRWRAEVGGAFDVLVDDGTVFHPGSDGTLRAYSALTGALRWSWSSGTNTALTSPIATPAGLLVGASAGGLSLLDPKTGAKVWEYDEPMLLEGLTATPTVSGRSVYFVTNAGFLHAMVAPKTDANKKRLTHRWFGRK